MFTQSKDLLFSQILHQDTAETGSTGTAGTAEVHCHVMQYTDCTEGSFHHIMLILLTAGLLCQVSNDVYLTGIYVAVVQAGSRPPTRATLGLLCCVGSTVVLLRSRPGEASSGLVQQQCRRRRINTVKLATATNDNTG